jgi:Mg/Co/Ni transporter MgtE
MMKDEIEPVTDKDLEKSISIMTEKERKEVLKSYWYFEDKSDEELKEHVKSTLEDLEMEDIEDLLDELDDESLEELMEKYPELNLF